MLLGYAMVTYLGKIFFLAALMIAFKHTTLFHFRSFGFTMLGLTLVWLAAETRAVLKTKIFYADPSAIPDSLKPVAPARPDSTAESEPSPLGGR